MLSTLSDVINMELVTAKSAAVWVWDTFAEKILASGGRGIKNKWSKFNWHRAEEQYCKNMQAQLGTVRLLGA